MVSILALVALGMIITKVTYKAPGVGENKVAEETVTPTESQEDTDSKYPLWDRLPYFGEGFTIDRYVAPGRIVIKLQGIDREIVEVEVRKWYEDNGVDPEMIGMDWEE